MVERKLSDQQWEPANVHVQIEEHDGGVEYMLLADIDGVFLGPEAATCPHDTEGLR